MSAGFACSFVNDVTKSFLQTFVHAPPEAVVPTLDPACSNDLTVMSALVNTPRPSTSINLRTLVVASASTSVSLQASEAI